MYSCQVNRPSNCTYYLVVVVDMHLHHDWWITMSVVFAVLLSVGGVGGGAKIRPVATVSA